ncbi:NUDIX hydrolase [archaeon]|nr:NUDIX hydrolase [archaeon]
MKLIQKAVIKKDNKFLILLRSLGAKYFPEHWDFPGGALEPNEEPFAGIEREVFEETALKIKALKIVGIYELDLDNVGKNTHRFTVYSARIISGGVKPSHEHLRFKWATKNEILQLKIEPYVKLYFEEHP